MNSLSSLSPQQLRRAADIQERILSLQGELNRILGEAPSAPIAAAPVSHPAGKRKLSPQAIANIRAGVRKRLAAQKAKAGPTRPAATRTLTPAARRRLAEIARARWAKVKAAGKSKL